jgi:uncharacterized protein (DUF2235 family)
MPRNLVVLCDGTYNDPADNTNVVRLRDALAEPAECVRYDEGVGVTEKDTKKGFFGQIVDRLAGGAFGSGLSGNVQQGYSWVCENYQEGDRLYFLGFSRGAYTARSLVGMIRKIGLVRGRPDKKILERAFERYRDEHHPKCPKTEAFRAQLNTRRVEELTLQFLGVWDTVGALGVPVVGPRSLLARRRWGFHDLLLSSHVKVARHALAIDEKRAAFLPAPWCSDPTLVGPDVEQRWFAGCHSDVGGRHGQLGYHWLASEAEKAGLRFREPLVAPDRPQVLHESLSAAYRAFTGAASRPIKEPASAGGGRFLNETIFEKADELQREDHGLLVDVPPASRANFQAIGKLKGVHLAFGAFAWYYAGQYDDLCKPAKPCPEMGG